MNTKEEQTSLKIFIITEIEYYQTHPLLIFTIPLEYSDLHSLIEHVNYLLMVSSDGINELGECYLRVRPTEGLHPNVFESVLHLIPRL